MHRDILAAVEAFDAWAQPWAFLRSVVSCQTLTAADRAMIHQVWREACDARHWQTAASAEVVLGQALQERFPWLTERARVQFIRAAFYEWK